MSVLDSGPLHSTCQCTVCLSHTVRVMENELKKIVQLIHEACPGLVTEGALYSTSVETALRLVREDVARPAPICPGCGAVVGPMVVGPMPPAPQTIPDATDD